MICRFRYTRAAFVFLAPNRHWGSTGFYRKFPARKALQSPLGTRCTETKFNMGLLDRHLKSRGHAASISLCFGGRRWYRVDRNLGGYWIFSRSFSSEKTKIKNQQNQSGVTLRYRRTESSNDCHRIATKVLHNLLRGCNSVTLILRLQFYLQS